MSKNESSVYAVVDISKKRKNRQNCLQQGNKDPEDTQVAYAELRQSSSSVAAIVSGVGSHGNKHASHDVSSFDNPFYGISSAAGIMGTTEYHSPSSPSPATYSQIDGSQISQQPLMARKTGPVISKRESNAKHCCSLHPCLLALFIVLVIIIVAIFVSLVVGFVLIARLNSDLAAMSSSSDSPLVSGLTGLESSFQAFGEKSNQMFLAMQEQVNMRLKQVEDQARNLSYIQDKLSIFEGEVTDKIHDIDSNFSQRIKEQTQQLASYIDQLLSNTMNISTVTLDSVSSLKAKLVSNIRALHVFDSCSTVVNLSLPFSSGMYWVRSSNGSSIQVYCSTSISMSCNGKTRGWRRVAYLDTSESGPVQCPGELEQNRNKRSCRQSNPGPGCSSVSFSVGDISYSCIYGRVNALHHGSLDAFTNSSLTLEDNYVDGVSLTYGTPRHHIWTLAAIRHHVVSCNRCNRNKPAFIGSNFSCEVYLFCSSMACFNRLLWNGSRQQCNGNSVFYRQLPQPTVDDIEMRVCRNQDRNNEDIFITFVEVFVF